MGIIDYIDTPQSWSYSWCWTLFAFGAMAALAFIVQMIAVMKLTKKPSIMIVLMAVFGALFAIATYMTQFWTCRAALKPFA